MGEGCWIKPNAAPPAGETHGTSGVADGEPQYRELVYALPSPPLLHRSPLPPPFPFHPRSFYCKHSPKVPGGFPGFPSHAGPAFLHPPPSSCLLPILLFLKIFPTQFHPTHSSLTFLALYIGQSIIRPANGNSRESSKIEQKKFTHIFF